MAPGYKEVAWPLFLFCMDGKIRFRWSLPEMTESREMSENMAVNNNNKKQTMCRFSSRCLLLIAAAVVVLITAGVSRLSAEDKNADHIQPYAKNPRYWQYERKPVMLLGGNKWDAPFFVQDQKSVYDDLQAAGGNYLLYILKQRQ